MQNGRCSRLAADRTQEPRTIPGDRYKIQSCGSRVVFDSARTTSGVSAINGAVGHGERACILDISAATRCSTAIYCAALDSHGANVVNVAAAAEGIAVGNGAVNDRYRPAAGNIATLSSCIASGNGQPPEC